MQRTEQLINEIEKAGNNIKQIIDIAESMIKYYRKHYKIKTCKGYLTQDRREIKKRFGTNHPILNLKYEGTEQKIFTLKLEEMTELKDSRNIEVKHRAIAQNRIQISASEFITACDRIVQDALKPGSGKMRIGVALAAVTGRRINSEILCSGAFFEPEDNEIMFSGQAKNRAKTKPYKISTLINAETVHKLWIKLCGKKTYSENNKDMQCIIKEPYTLHRKDHYKLFKSMENELVDYRKSVAFSSSKELGKVCKKYFGFIPGIKTKELRGINALVTAYINLDPKHDGTIDTADMLRKSEEHLGHKTQNQTSEYQKYEITE